MLHICKPKRRSTVSKELTHKYSLTREILLLINFCELHKISFSGTLIFANRTEVFTSLTLSFASSEKHASDDPYNLVKLERSCKTCDEFRDVERYPTVI